MAGDRKSRPQCGRERRRGRGRKGAEVPPTSAHHVVLRWRGGHTKKRLLNRGKRSRFLKQRARALGGEDPETAFEGQTVPGEAVVGGETGRVGRAGGQAGRAQLLCGCIWGGGGGG